MSDVISTAPEGQTVVRRRSLRGEPTSTLAASPGASLANLVSKGQGIPEIALALGLTHDEVRTKLKEANLLELVEAPPDPSEPEGEETEPPPVEVTRATLNAAFPIAAPPPAVVIDQGPKRRTRGPNKPRADLPVAPPPDLFPPTRPEPTTEDYAALGKLVAKARTSGATIEDMVADARALLKLVELFGY